MASTYTVNIGIEKPGTGDQSGTWGTTTNTNFDIIDQATNGVATVTLAAAGTSGSPNTLLINNGALSDGRNRFIEFNDGADLGATAYVQLDPDDAEKIVHIRNSLTASRSLILFQGTYNASNDFEVPNGADVLVKFDGGGAGATVTDVNVNLTPTKVTTGDLDVDNININGNTIISTDTNGNIALTPNGTGEVDISKVDIASGEIDGTTIGANSAAAITGTTITGTSFVSSGDMTFGDNDKAIFGAGSDLQIYHDGSNSYISDQGTGNLRILAEDFRVVNAANSETMIQANVDSDVRLYYDSSQKLATTNTGVDVTGTITFDGGTTSADLNFGDGDKAVFGAGSDLQIYHDGSGSYVSDQGVGPLNLLSGGVRLKDPTDTTTMLVANSGGAVTLYHNDSSKLATTATGIDVTGEVQADSLDIDGDGTIDGKLTITTADNTTQLELKSTDTDANEGPRLDLRRDSASPADSDTLGTIRFLGEDDAGTNITYGELETRIDDVTAATASGSVRLNVRRNDDLRSVFIANNTTVAFNESGDDIDFRVESNGNANMLFVDGGNDRVGIGTNSPARNLHVSGGTDTRIRTEESGGSFVDLTVTNAGHFIDSTDTGSLTINKVGSAFMNFKTSNTERMRIDSSGNVGIGTSSPADRLHVSNGSSGRSSFTSNTDVIIEDNGNAALQFASPNTNVNAIYFSDPESNTAGVIQYSHSTNEMSFDTNDTTRMTIGSNGVVGIGTTSPSANLEIDAGSGTGTHLQITTTGSGHNFDMTNSSNTARIRNVDSTLRIGADHNNEAADSRIQFDVDDSERARIDSDGLKFNGDSSADNALDDYEQGSWTVDLQDSSGNSATGINGNGRYIKVGNLVTVWGRFSDPDLTGLTSGDDVRIYGLPFTSSAFAGDALQFIGSVRMENVAFASSPDGYVNTNIIEGATYIRLGETRNNAGDDFIVVSQLSATSEMRFTATYPTTAF